MPIRKLPLSLYQRDDVVALSRQLLGKLVCTRIDGQLCKAIISETEAYAGEIDRASHAYGGRRTPRTEVMYAAGGCAYVYLCYGIHHLFNVVSNVEGVPHAVLIRGVLPVSGREMMQKRRGRDGSDLVLMDGPGKVAQGLGITTALSGESLRGKTLWLEEADIEIPAGTIVVGPRIGVDYAGSDAALPYRFRLSDAYSRKVLAAL